MVRVQLPRVSNCHTCHSLTRRCGSATILRSLDTMPFPGSPGQIGRHMDRQQPASGASWRYAEMSRCVAVLLAVLVSSCAETKSDAEPWMPDNLIGCSLVSQSKSVIRSRNGIQCENVLRQTFRCLESQKDETVTCSETVDCQLLGQ